MSDQTHAKNLHKSGISYYRYLMVFMSGLMIIALLSLLAGYMMYLRYQEEHEHRFKNIIKIFKHHFEAVPSHFEYLKHIGLDHSLHESVTRFREIALVVKQNTRIVNSICLIKIYHDTPDETIRQELRDIHGRDIGIRNVLQVVDSKNSSSETQTRAIVVSQYPERGEEGIIGMDLMGEDARARALDDVMDQNKFTLTAPLKTIHDKHHQPNGFASMVFFYPIPDASTGRVEYVLATPLSFEKVVESLLSDGLLDSSVHVTLHDVSGEGKKTVFDNKADEKYAVDLEKQHADTRVARDVFSFGGRQFEVVFHQHDTLTLRNFWQPMVGFASGVAFVLLTTYLLYYREKKERQFEKMATIDPLTQIYNRHFFNEFFYHQIQNHERYETPFGMILADIDHFKKVNDTFGHLEGDRVLVKVAEIIKQYTRQSDLVARWGGEEFAILLKHTDLAGAKQVAEKLREAIEAASMIDSMTVTCSFGVTVMGRYDDQHTIFKRADEALYQAKHQGRNLVIACDACIS